MKFKSLIFLFIPFLSFAQQEYSLPLFVIDTEGKTIVDEPKVMAKLKVIDNGKNKPTDIANEYDGFIGIEFRGSSSQGFPKKPFGFETWDKDGEDMEASFFGWPPEEDWILYPSYNEKSMIHNVLSMRLANEMGMYASRTKYVEVFVNGSYEGVYVLMEKIKKSDGRVDINKLKEDEESGEDLTGGYIIKIDKATGSNIGSWQSSFLNPPSSSNRSYYLYEYPSDITETQKSYIRKYFQDFEIVMSGNTLGDSTSGYHKYIDPESFIKYILINEVSKNVDGYRISTYLHKDKNGKLKAGPVWDYDIAYGNANYCEGDKPQGWAYRFNNVCTQDNWLVPFWWEKLITEPAFRKAFHKEYRLQRDNGILKTENIMALIDENANEIKDAQLRNYTRWKILGQYVWPQPEPIPTTWQGEVNELKEWLTKRLAWLDANITAEDAPLNIIEIESSQFVTYPNPFVNQLNLKLKAKENAEVNLSLINSRGKEIWSEKRNIFKGQNELSIVPNISVSQQLLILKVSTEGQVLTKRVIRN
ncbi:Por secretion system C-terminal sorting domain-containing protein [Spirosomataceae bacterium TFI 002]|nr:Por secretion system C-terminal sorting domain-containing protein [Spirosomataceae bacterium TFI 002]